MLCGVGEAAVGRWLEVELDGVTVVNPEKCDKFDEYVNLLYETRKSKGMTVEKATEILKNDYLTLKDFRGKKNYLTASGEISEGAVICIKEVIVGDVVLKNIEASVVKNQKAPLLLGQSVLERFGSITIDNTNAKLIITKY